MDLHVWEYHVFLRCSWWYGEYINQNREQISAHRSMCGLMINVDKRSADIGQNLYLVLELLTKVMSLPQWGICVHDNVDFDKIVLDPSQEPLSIKIALINVLVRSDRHSEVKCEQV